VIRKIIIPESNWALLIIIDIIISVSYYNVNKMYQTPFALQMSHLLVESILYRIPIDLPFLLFFDVCTRKASL
jgi:hypothetical protein